MNVAYEKLKQHEIQVCSVKTDVLVIDKCNLDKAQSLLKFGNGIGEWKFCNRFRSPSQPFDRKPSFLENITEYSNETGGVKDDWNNDEIINEHILPTKRLMVRDDVAGTGKSCICKHLQERKYKVVFVVPTNNLKQECGAEAVTINKFFGRSYGDEKLNNLFP